MFVINKSRWSKIILLLLIFTIFEKGWVVKIRPAVEMGTIIVTQEALSAVALAASFLWRAYTNSHDSAVDHLFGQEIDRLANHNGVSGAHSTISANIPQQISHIIAQQEKPASTIKSVTTVQQASSTPITKSVATVQYASSVQKKPGQTISNTSTNACNVPDKSCAVVSSVAHEQVAQMTQTTIDESQKIAAQKLLNNVAADWHIQMDRRSGELMRSVCAHEYNQSQVYEQKWGKEYTSETHLNGGTTYRAPNQKFSLSVCPATQHRPYSVADDIARQRLEEQRQIVCDPYLRAEILQELTAFTNNARHLIYGALHERVAALLNLVDFHIRWSAYGQPLEYVQRGIYAQYASKDGSICIARLFDMTDAHNIFKKYIAPQKRVAPRFSKPCQKVQQSSTSRQIKKNSQLIKKRNKVDFRTIRNNRTNQLYKQMLAAFACGDMEQVEQIKNNNTQLQDLTILYNSLKAEYDKIILHQESLLKDEYGIVHFKLPIEHRDPAYTVLPKHSRAQLKCNPSALASFNDTLKLRQLYKNAFHKAWDIPKTAIPAVHQALYALIDIDTIPERINKIHKLSINNKISVPEQQSLVEALFLPNGIIRDFAEYDRAKRLSMPRAILRPEHAATRTLLNQLVYAERTCNDGQIESECAAAIEYLQEAVVANDVDKAQFYLFCAQDVFTQIATYDYETLVLFNEQQQPKGNAGKTPRQNNYPNQKEPKNNNSDPASPGTAAIALLKAIDESKEKAIEVFNKTCEWITTTNNGLQVIKHVFENKPGHNFGPLLTRMGANIAYQDDVLRVGSKIFIDVTEKLITMGSILPIKDGVYYDILVEYGGEIITTRGRIIHGVFKMSTMFIQPQHVR